MLERCRKLGLPGAAGLAAKPIERPLDGSTKLPIATLDWLARGVALRRNLRTAGKRWKVPHSDLEFQG